MTGDLSKKLDFLNSPELAALREAWTAEEARQEAEDEAWWDSLTMEGRAQAFRQVCKLIYRADIKDKGSYRYGVYDIFNVDYVDGMKHYMAIHNAISKALSSPEEQRLDA
jgi:hypothetical protein